MECQNVNWHSILIQMLDYCCVFLVNDKIIMEYQKKLLILLFLFFFFGVGFTCFPTGFAFTI